MCSKKLDQVFIYSGKLISKTGMLIGGPESEVQIGGIDKVPIQHQGEPYVPGSSLKGKIRSLLELKYAENNDKIFDKSGICVSPNHKIGKLFGTKMSASRAIFRDAFLTKECRDRVLGGTDDTERFYEIKVETSIDRRKGTVGHGSLRTVKRTIPGLEFQFEIVLLGSSEDEPETKELKSLLVEGLKLLEKNYLGGSGSRGYGKVEVKIEVDGAQK